MVNHGFPLFVGLRQLNPDSASSYAEVSAPWRSSRESPWVMSSGWPKHIRLERSHCLPHLHALHNQTVIDGSFQAVMPDGLIGRALIPCLGRLEAREFRDHDALDGIAFQDLKTAVVDEDLNLVTCEGCPDLVPINLQLRLIEGFLACKYQVSAHFSCSPAVVLLVAAVREDDFSRH